MEMNKADTASVSASAQELRGAEILVKALQAENVQYIWGYPGGAVLHIYDAFYKQDTIQHVLVRHEQAAVHAADGFARATGEVGVALVTSGPGLTNAVTGIATAYMDSIPMVIISGQVPTAAIGLDAFQECDTVGITRPIVKHNFLVKDARQIAEVNRTDGDIDTLQGRIAAIRSWSYIAQRPDWVLAREEMAARARAAEARLSDALHGRLTERFVNRRTSVLMKKLGPDAGLLPVTVEDDRVLVDGEAIGVLAGFRFRVDPAARLADHKLLLAAAERHLPTLLAERAGRLSAALAAGESVDLVLSGAILEWEGEPVARLVAGKTTLAPGLVLEPTLSALPPNARRNLELGLGRWLDQALRPLNPLRRLEDATRDITGGPELRALLIRLVESGGAVARADSGVETLNPVQRQLLRRLKVQVGALDIFVPAMLRPAPLAAWRTLQTLRGKPGPAPHPAMPPVLALAGKSKAPPGYRAVGKQALRLDMAEKLLHAAHGLRSAGRGKPIVLDPALAISMGLGTPSYAQLLRQAGFQPLMPRPLPAGAQGPLAPPRWRWRPIRRESAGAPPSAPAATGAFAALAALVR